MYCFSYSFTFIGKSYSDKGDYKGNHHGNYYPSNMGQMTAPPPFINGMQTSQTNQNSQNDRETEIKRFILLVLPFLIFSPESKSYSFLNLAQEVIRMAP